MQRFLLIGRTGVGKSSYINAAFGVPIARTNRFEACTKIVEHHQQGTPWGNLCLIDTPGMAENDADVDRAYLELIKRDVDIKTLKSSIYLTRLDETRFRPDEKSAILRITDVLGHNIWCKSILVLTFAANVPQMQRQERVYRRINDLQEFLQMYVPYTWNGFDSIFLVDNIVPNWSADGEPIAKAMLSVL